MGAEIIKVESVTGGDGSRETPPFVSARSLYFDSLNRGKKSVALNLKTAEAQEILHRLLKNSDVLVENFRPGVRDRLGCSDSDLKKINPDLIVCSISGFGQAGRYSKSPSYDIIVQAMSGMMSINGPAGSNGMRVGFSIGDIAAGLFATIGVLSRLYDRDVHKTAPAMPLDISMLTCQLALLENAYARSLNTNDNPAPIGSRHPSMVPFESYTAADADLVIGLGTNADWPRFCEAIEAPQIFADQRYATTTLRLEHRDALEIELNALLGKKPRDYWIERLWKANIAAGPQVSVREFGEDPFAEETDAFETVTAAGCDFRFVRHPLKDPTTPPLSAAPALGEDTFSCLEGLGYTRDQIVDFGNRSIVAYPAT